MSLPRFNASVITGPIMIGLVAAAVLFGCALIQMCLYYKNFPNDRWQLKCLLWLTSHNQLWSAYYLVHCPRILVQMFFTYRLYELSPRPILPSICAFLVTCIFRNGNGSSPPNFVLMTMCDVTVALALSYHLYQRRKDGSKRTTRMIDRLILYTIETGLITSMADLAEAVCYWAIPNTCALRMLQRPVGTLTVNLGRHLGCSLLSGVRNLRQFIPNSVWLNSRALFTFSRISVIIITVAEETQVRSRNAPDTEVSDDLYPQALPESDVA
ncbi:hypothetical protein BU15DRAFT_63418 [Melanogaster broomeanus]|nr:hypothetical protein BU15DRAFT_63418 [Melanogaster broomeanus]